MAVDWFEQSMVGKTYQVAPTTESLHTSRDIISKANGRANQDIIVEHDNTHSRCPGWIIKHTFTWKPSKVKHLTPSQSDHLQQILGFLWLIEQQYYNCWVLITNKSLNQNSVHNWHEYFPFFQIFLHNEPRFSADGYAWPSHRPEQYTINTYNDLCVRRLLSTNKTERE